MSSFLVASACLLLHFVWRSDSLSNAFCKSREGSTGSKLFPLDVPTLTSQLWPWDAIHDDKKGTVEVTIIQRRACKFNRTIWQQLNTSFPHQSKYIAYGKESNILVDANSTRLAPLEVVTCYFYRNGNSTPIAQTKSEEIRGMLHYIRIGTTQITCPSPRQKFDTMRLVRTPRNAVPSTSKIKSKSNSLKSAMTMARVAVVKVATHAFPVCNSTFLREESMKGTDGDFERRKKGRLSVCTATSRSDRARLVEWIEYHRLIGVDHFYIYDTSRRQSSHNVLSALSDYVSEGVVTVVLWGYENCVIGMASGRYVSYTGSDGGGIFKAPKAIAQSAALASCYSRYRSHTEYMMHIDDDEFIAMGSSVLKKGPGLGHTQSNLLYNGNIYRPLAEFVDKTFKDQPELPALTFSPLSKHACPEIEGMASETRIRSGLPRIGEWLFSRQVGVFEGKMVMKTSAVRMFYVHYVSQLEKGLHDYGTLLVSAADFAMLHYKDPGEKTGDIFGPFDFGTYKQGSTPHHCIEMIRFGGLREDIEGGYFPVKGQPATPLLHGHNYTNIIQNIDPTLHAILVLNYNARFQKNMMNV